MKKTIEGKCIFCQTTQKLSCTETSRFSDNVYFVVGCMHCYRTNMTVYKIPLSGWKGSFKLEHAKKIVD